MYQPLKPYIMMKINKLSTSCENVTRVCLMDVICQQILTGKCDGRSDHAVTFAWF